jgi:uncharacterized protein
MHTVTHQMNPTTGSERILSLDVLRGFAVLGILLMNIQSFAMIEAAYINPAAYGDLTGANKWTWILVHIVADQKFMTIFSILFGAGILVFAERIRAKGLKPRNFFYKRMLWLLVAGLLHAYLLWHGDILVTYAICGIIAFWVRNWRVRGLLTLGIVLLAVPAFNYWLFGKSIEFWPDEAVRDLANSWDPKPEAVAAEVEAMRGSYVEQMSVRAPAAFRMQTFIFLIWYGWRAAGLMLIGLALIKADVITAGRSYGFYVAGMVLGLAIGLPLVIIGVKNNFLMDWNVRYSMFLGWQWNYAGSVFIAYAYVCKVMILVKAGLFGRVLRIVARTGRMAFSSYILMSVLCSFFFYGHGLGYFGKLERLEQMAVVAVVWIIVLLFANLWIQKFTHGPLEWLWRKLTYGRFMTTHPQRT